MALRARRRDLCLAGRVCGLSPRASLVGEASATFPLYTGITIRTAHDEGQYYRVVFRNSGSSAHGQIRLQGYDGANWHISQYWNPGVDFDSLKKADEVYTKNKERDT